MKELEKKVLKLVKGVTQSEVERYNRRWPPYCTGIYHQPKRPLKK